MVGSQDLKFLEENLKFGLSMQSTERGILTFSNCFFMVQLSTACSFKVGLLISFLCFSWSEDPRGLCTSSDQGTKTRKSAAMHEFHGKQEYKLTGNLCWR